MMKQPRMTETSGRCRALGGLASLALWLECGFGLRALAADLVQRYTQRLGAPVSAAPGQIMHIIRYQLLLGPVRHDPQGRAVRGDVLRGSASLRPADARLPAVSGSMPGGVRRPPAADPAGPGRARDRVR